MGKANNFGPSSGGSRVLDAVLVDFDDPDQEPVVSDAIPLEHYDGCSVQLISGGARSITVLEGDSVDESSRTFVLKSGNFSENDVGGIVTIDGSAEGNDGDYEVESVTNAFTFVSVETPNDDESFDPDAVTAELVQNSPRGSWDFRVSNSKSFGNTVETENDGSPWTPIGSQFVPPIAAVSAQYIKDTSNSANQYCQAAPMMAAAFQLRFTPTAGRGPISAFVDAKGSR